MTEASYALKRDLLLFIVGQAARWRQSLVTKFPADSRNRHAADLLSRLADQRDCEQALLQAAFTDFGRAKETISAACRDVGFRRDINSLNDLLRAAVDHLNSRRAAA